MDSDSLTHLHYLALHSFRNCFNIFRQTEEQLLVVTDSAGRSWSSRCQRASEVFWPEKIIIRRWSCFGV